MQTTGHKTRGGIERDNIVSAGDLTSVRSPMKIDADDKELFESVERLLHKYAAGRLKEF